MTATHRQPPTALEQARAMHPAAAAITTAGGRGRSTVDDPVPSFVAGLYDASECHDRLASGSTGRLCYSAGRGPLSPVVSYALTADGVVLVPVAEFDQARQCVPGHDVLLEATGRLSTGDRWVVRVRGTAATELVAYDDWFDQDRTGSADEPRPPRTGGDRGGPGASLAIPISTIRGFWTTAVLRLTGP